MERSSTPPMSAEYPKQRNFISRSGNKSHCVESSLSAQTAYQYYQVMMQLQPQFYQKNPHGLQNHSNPSMPPQYNNIPHVAGMTSAFPYYPYGGVCLQQVGQMPNNSNNHSRTGFGQSCSSPAESKINKVDRREAALMKFRQKRKERCFDKKIRYVNRKHLAERRPRVRGQFVRKVNGIDVDLNG
ncbi:hypothetical protein ACFE04_010885 [Oxalis oulophora]